MLTGDRNYCVPIAYAVAKGCGYREAFELHAAAGRVKGKGMTFTGMHDCWYKAGLRLSDPIIAKRHLCGVLKDPRLQSGTWLINVRRHVFVIKDGAVHDFPKPLKSKAMVLSVHAVTVGEPLRIPTLAQVAEHMLANWLPEL